MAVDQENLTVKIHPILRALASMKGARRKSPLAKARALCATLCLLTAMAGCSGGGGEFDATCGNNLDCMGWYVTDYCDDDINAGFQFFSAKHSGQTWGPFSTNELGKYVTGALDCAGGDTICMGAWSGKESWGVGKDNDKFCEDCCGTCNGMSYTFMLHCH